MGMKVSEKYIVSNFCVTVISNTKARYWTESSTSNDQLHNIETKPKVHSLTGLQIGGLLRELFHKNSVPFPIFPHSTHIPSQS
jgi:hypothetical protein